jgi:hypothetical protein
LVTLTGTSQTVNIAFTATNQAVIQLFRSIDGAAESSLMVSGLLSPQSDIITKGATLSQSVVYRIVVFSLNGVSATSTAPAIIILPMPALNATVSNVAASLGTLTGNSQTVSIAFTAANQTIIQLFRSIGGAAETSRTVSGVLSPQSDTITKDGGLTQSVVYRITATNATGVVASSTSSALIILPVPASTASISNIVASLGTLTGTSQAVSISFTPLPTFQRIFNKSYKLGSTICNSCNWNYIAI